MAFLGGTNLQKVPYISAIYKSWTVVVFFKSAPLLPSALDESIRYSTSLPENVTLKDGLLLIQEGPATKYKRSQMQRHDTQRH